MDPQVAELETDPLLWLCTLFPRVVTEPFGDFHLEFWEWVWAMRAGLRPKPLVAVWSRDFAKSSNAEMAVVALGARKVRTYGLYISGTQDQADDHVGNIGGLLESKEVEAFYPDLANRSVGKYGNSKGWRRNRLRTRSGLVVDAMGLDSAARGAKVDEQRPDFMVIDDVDEETDSANATAKKMKALTKKLLPAGANDLAVLAIQNLIHPDSIFSQLVDGRADFLADRIISGPIPAVENLEVEQQGNRFIIVGGKATWAGMDLNRCQEVIDDIGITAFRSEHLHDVEAPPGGMFDHLSYERCDWDDLPELVRTVVWVDPAVTDTDNSDSMGIQADALGVDGKIYRLWSWEQRSTPVDAITRAIRKALQLGAREVGIETDQGGDTWESVYKEACRTLKAEGVDGPYPRYKWEKAGAGHGPKRERAGRMLAAYETGRFVHVNGTHHVLERGLNRFPETKPYDLVDAAYWAFYALNQPKTGPTTMTAPTGRRTEPVAGRPPTTVTARRNGRVPRRVP